MASDSDSRQATLFDVDAVAGASAPTGTDADVSVVRDGNVYRVKVRGEEVTLTDWSLLAFSRSNGKWNVEMGGKTFAMDDAEVGAFHVQLCKATPATEGDEDEEADDGELD